MVTRDAIGWWIGMIGAVVVAVLLNAGMFPTIITPHIRESLMLVSIIVATVSGWMKTSPLPGKNDQQGAGVGAITPRGL